MDGRMLAFDFLLRQAMQAVLTHLRLVGSGGASLFFRERDLILAGLGEDAEVVSSVCSGLSCSALTATSIGVKMVSAAVAGATDDGRRATETVVKEVLGDRR